jgi:Gas vesicle synthesis protein GvpL/GvpF
MSWYAYCITEQKAFQGENRARRPFIIEGLKGVGGAQIYGYPSGEFAVIVSDYAGTGTLDQQSILEHARVVSECFRNTTVLPFRFGTVFNNDEALRRAVRANRRAFLESVSRLRGKAEMHLKLIVKDGTVREAIADKELPATVGREYLSKLREQATRQRERQTKARALSVQVHKLFHPLEEEVSCKKVVSGGMLIDIAHLIDHKSVAQGLRAGHQRAVAAVPLHPREASLQRRQHLKPSQMRHATSHLG